MLGDKPALNAQQVRGMELFGSIGCKGCHAGAAFAGPAAKMGEPVLQRFPVDRGEPATSRSTSSLRTRVGPFRPARPTDEHLWRVPTLRNLKYTAPYMHNGSVKSLTEAARVMASTQLGRELEPGQAEDLGAFLFALTGEFPAQTMPRLPPTPGDLLL